MLETVENGIVVLLGDFNESSIAKRKSEPKRMHQAHTEADIPSSIVEIVIWESDLSGKSKQGRGIEI